MANVHYKHLEKTINEFFAKKGMKVVIEPHGSYGADLEGTDGTQMVGEIKNVGELARDLPSTYWKDWNSTQRFGGKTPEYRLAEHVPADAANLDGKVQGWIAVVFGQLNHYRKKNSMPSGWLVFEDYGVYHASLKEALSYLKKNKKIQGLSTEEFKDVSFSEITL